MEPGTRSVRPPLPEDLERFAFEDLEAFQLSLEVADMADDMAMAVKRTRPWVAKQLGRAGLSVVANAGEAAGEYSRGDKARFYRYAVRSATETAAIVIFLARRALITVTQEVAFRRLLLKTIKTLTRMVVHFQRAARARR